MVSFGNLAVPRSARADVAAAFRYLSADRGERRLIGRLEHGTRDYRLRIVHDGNDRYDPNDDTIWWDPRSAMRTTAGGVQSPALGLGHEIDHAVENPAREQRLAWTPDSHYDDKEERRVITGSETHAAHTLGEGVRHDHRGRLLRVSSPTALA